jgi:hypothetical protein
MQSRLTHRGALRVREKRRTCAAVDKSNRPRHTQNSGHYHSGGIGLGAVVSDIHEVSAQAIIGGLIEGKDIEELVGCTRGKLKAKRSQLLESLDAPLSERHRLLLVIARDHIAHLEARIAELDTYLIAAMQPYDWAWRLLQTLPGVDQVSAAQILIETGVLCELANAAAKTKSVFKAKYESLAIRAQQRKRHRHRLATRSGSGHGVFSR